MKQEQKFPFIIQKVYSAYLGLLLLVFISSCAGHKKSVSKRELRKIDYHTRELDKGDAATDLSPRELKKINDSDERISKVIKEARSYSGVPYSWGGTTRSGMDCSGLLFTSFKYCGLEIPRTSSEQSKSGRAITLYELRPGDFVFFATRKGRPNLITHVGMVTEILDKHNVQFIHASTKLGVIESNIFTDYYRRNFVKARRLF